MQKVVRKKGEAIFIGDDIEVVILDVKDGQVRLGIHVADTLPVYKGEVYEMVRQMRLFNREAVYSADLRRVHRLFSK